MREWAEKREEGPRGVVPWKPQKLRVPGTKEHRGPSDAKRTQEAT